MATVADIPRLAATFDRQRNAPLKAVDVTRGPASSVYGSGAIGGVVSFTTLDADDVLDEGETIGAQLKTGVEYLPALRRAAKALSETFGEDGNPEPDRRLRAYPRGHM